MSFLTHNEQDRNAGVVDAERSLRLIASLPAPDGIEDRVKSGCGHSDSNRSDWVADSHRRTGRDGRQVCDCGRLLPLRL